MFALNANAFPCNYIHMVDRMVGTLMHRSQNKTQSLHSKLNLQLTCYLVNESCNVFV